MLPAIVASILPVFLIGALVGPMGSELGYREATAGLLMAAFFAVSALVSRKAGALADSVGPITTLQIGLVGSAIVAAGVAAGVRSVTLLAIAMMVGGACNALTQIAANVYLARYLPPDRHGLAFAVKQSANPGGAMAAGLLLPTLVLNLGWRSAFVVAACGAGCSAVALQAGRNWPPAVPVPDVGIRQGAVTTSPPPTGGRDRALILVAASAAFGSASAVALGGFFVESGRNAGMALGTAGLAASVGSAFAIAGRVATGVWADHTLASPRRILGWVAVMLAVGSLALVVFGIRAPAAHWLALPVAYGAGWAWPGVFNLAVVRARPGEPGRATGVSQTGIYVGTTLGPLVLGPVSERGYPLTWSVAALLAVVGAVGMWAARSRLDPQGAGGGRRQESRRSRWSRRSLTEWMRRSGCRMNSLVPHPAGGWSEG